MLLHDLNLAVVAIVPDCHKYDNGGRSPFQCSLNIIIVIINSIDIDIDIDIDLWWLPDSMYVSFHTSKGVLEKLVLALTFTDWSTFFALLAVSNKTAQRFLICGLAFPCVAFNCFLIGIIVQFPLNL